MNLLYDRCEAQLTGKTQRGDGSQLSESFLAIKSSPGGLGRKEGGISDGDEGSGKGRGDQIWAAYGTCTVDSRCVEATGSSKRRTDKA